MFARCVVTCDSPTASGRALSGLEAGPWDIPESMTGVWGVRGAEVASHTRPRRRLIAPAGWCAVALTLGRVQLLASMSEHGAVSLVDAMWCAHARWTVPGPDGRTTGAVL